ncbi:MAG TPA: DUF2306 domain-containing protein, partial [Devosia sp.]|nr:DUF2306 domain-containing protein [Devosia sp.]
MAGEGSAKTGMSSMNFSPLLQAPLAIQAHALAAILAFVIGPVIFFRPKGGALHRLLGRVWVLAMAVVIASSFFIFQLRMWGPFSPIHLLSAWSAHALFQGVMLARRGRIAEHRALMKNLYFGALIAAGTFTFLPGRIMNEVLF